jgi:DNA-directed RNA polymerase subunit E'
MDDYLKSNIASGVILANQSGRTLKIGSTIRTRITAVSLGKASTMGKIGITCRQPFLGADEWIEEDLKKASGVDEKEEKVEAKKEEKVKAKKEEKVKAKKEEKVEAKVK